MRLDLSKLKLHPHETESFFLKVRGNDDLLTEMGGKFKDPVEVEVEIENTGSLFACRGEVRTLLQLPCARCLQDFTYPVEQEFQAVIVSDPSPDGFDDEVFICLEGDSVDINPLVEEAIFMAVPLCPLCQEECRGLCPGCGQNKNTGTCSCKEDNIDPRWEKLKNLR
ncbi:MAG: DUF177 domain-containing protein [Syntrophomonadaceae bacterium]|nr:DUF177 domain-containing protein [Syntrophomonadaceae bacterium]